MIWHDFMAVALEDVEPTDFGPPDRELLADTSPKATLSVSPGDVDPGGRVVVSGSGFDLCVNGWNVVIDGPEGGVKPVPTTDAELTGTDEVEAPQPQGERVHLESAAQPGSTDSDRRAELIVPGKAATGTYRAKANCDSGSGLQPFGPTASFTVGGGAPTTTTSSSTSSTSTSSTTSTTEPRGGGSSTTTSSTTTSSTTTTSAPQANATGGP